MYSSLSPKIIPIISAKSNITEVIIDPDTIVRTRTFGVAKDNIKVEIKVFIDGKNVDNDEYNFSIENNKSLNIPICKKFSYLDNGYLEIYVSSKSPIFRRVIPEPGYATLKMGNSSIVINPDIKFGRSRLIAQTQNLTNFCMVHSAILIDKINNIKNSFLIINPYEKKITVKLTSQIGKSLKQTLIPHTVSLVDLSKLIDEESSSIEAVMLSAPNRVVVYDIKHKYDDINNIYSIDHLDPYSGRTTYHEFSLKGFLRNNVRKVFSFLNIRYD
tara:strand:- start:118 stop:933 length:816 start_codon:yes stop_codon:yes gene_type:complete